MTFLLLLLNYISFLLVKGETSITIYNDAVNIGLDLEQIWFDDEFWLNTDILTLLNGQQVTRKCNEYNCLCRYHHKKHAHEFFNFKLYQCYENDANSAKSDIFDIYYYDEDILEYDNMPLSQLLYSPSPLTLTQPAGKNGVDIKSEIGALPNIEATVYALRPVLTAQSKYPDLYFGLDSSDLGTANLFLSDDAFREAFTSKWYNKQVNTQDIDHISSSLYRVTHNVYSWYKSKDYQLWYEAPVNIFFAVENVPKVDVNGFKEKPAHELTQDPGEIWKGPFFASLSAMEIHKKYHKKYYDHHDVDKKKLSKTYQMFGVRLPPSININDYTPFIEFDAARFTPNIPVHFEQLIDKYSNVYDDSSDSFEAEDEVPPPVTNKVLCTQKIKQRFDHYAWIPKKEFIQITNQYCGAGKGAVFLPEENSERLWNRLSGFTGGDELSGVGTYIDLAKLHVWNRKYNEFGLFIQHDEKVILWDIPLEFIYKYKYREFQIPQPLYHTIDKTYITPKNEKFTNKNDWSVDLFKQTPLYKELTIWAAQGSAARIGLNLKILDEFTQDLVNNWKGIPPTKVEDKDKWHIKQKNIASFAADWDIGFSEFFILQLYTSKSAWCTKYREFFRPTNTLKYPIVEISKVFYSATHKNKRFALLDGNKPVYHGMKGVFLTKNDWNNMIAAKTKPKRFSGPASTTVDPSVAWTKFHGGQGVVFKFDVTQDKKDAQYGAIDVSSISIHSGESEIIVWDAPLSKIQIDDSKRQIPNM